MQILSDMVRFSIAPTPAREAAVGVVAVVVAAVLPLVLGASVAVRLAVPAVVLVVYGVRFLIAVLRGGRRGAAR